MAPVLGEIEAGEPDGAPTAGNLQPQLPGKCVPEAPQLLVTTKLLAPGHHCTPLTLAGTKGEGPSIPPYAPVIQAPGSVLKQDLRFHPCLQRKVTVGNLTQTPPEAGFKKWRGG